jgi:hypothetical protein
LSSASFGFERGILGSVRRVVLVVGPLLATLVLSACGRLGFDAPTTVDASDDGRASDGLDATTCEILCDDFETGTLGAAWGIDTAHAQIGVDAVHAHRGTYAVHAHTDAITAAVIDPRATLLGYQGLPITGTVYVRVWAFFAAPHPTAFFDQVINLADAPGNGISMGARNGNVTNNDYTASQYAESTTITLPIGVWTCVGFAMPSGTAGTARVSIDGAEVTDIALTKAAVQPAPTHVYIGLEWVGTVSNQAAVDAWFDDIRIGSAPIPCAQ